MGRLNSRRWPASEGILIDISRTMDRLERCWRRDQRGVLLKRLRWKRIVVEFVLGPWSLVAMLKFFKIVWVEFDVSAGVLASLVTWIMTFSRRSDWENDVSDIYSELIHWFIHSFCPFSCSYVQMLLETVDMSVIRNTSSIWPNVTLRVCHLPTNWLIKFMTDHNITYL